MLDGTNWGQNEVLRYDRYVPEQRLIAGLRADSIPLLRQTDLHLQARYRVPFDGVAAILYRDGTDFQGLHSDREMRWLDDTIIAIVVLGERRPFVIRPRTRWLDAAAQKVPAGKGEDDLILMPVGGNPAESWKCRIAVWVAGPNCPSAVRCSPSRTRASWDCRTRSPCVQSTSGNVGAS
jgi:alkylated DNA repair dioxygenase AlkB